MQGGNSSFGQKDIIVEVELEERNHQLHHLLRVLNKTFLQLFGITHLKNNKHFTNKDETQHLDPGIDEQWLYVNATGCSRSDSISLRILSAWKPHSYQALTSI